VLDSHIAEKGGGAKHPKRGDVSESSKSEYRWWGRKIPKTGRTGKERSGLGRAEEIKEGRVLSS